MHNAGSRNETKSKIFKDVGFYVVSDLFPDNLLVSLASAGSTAENRLCCRNKPVAYVETAMEKTVWNASKCIYIHTCRNTKEYVYMRRFICNYIYIIKWCFVTTTLCGVLVVCAASTFSFSSSSFSLSQLSLSTYIYPPSINLSLPDLSLSFYVSTSPTSPTSLSLINSLPTCLALSTSVAAWRLPLLASQNASTFRHFDISTFRHRLSLFDPRFEVHMFAPRRSPKCWKLPAIVQVPRKCKEPFFKDE